jgi:hypothetical protein
LGFRWVEYSEFWFRTTLTSGQRKTGRQLIVADPFPCWSV